jgi:hypothetical protein
VIGLALLMELVSSAISFMIGYYAFKAYKSYSSRSLFLLHSGFTVLGISLTLRVVTTVYFVVLRVAEVPSQQLKAVISFAGIVFTLTQLFAYSLFVLTYALQTKALEKTRFIGALFPILYVSFFHPYLEIVALVLLGYVTAQTLINLLLKKNLDSFLVFSGFTLMLLSHLCFLFMIANELLLLLGQTLQMIGFLCLLAMLVKVSYSG